jgi:phosphatidylserine decarboxylase
MRERKIRLGKLMLWGITLSSLILYLFTGDRTYYFLFAFTASVLILSFLLSSKDDEREIAKDSKVLLSPADGKVIDVKKNSVSIFMSLFDAHTVRSPCKGKVVEIKKIKGGHLPAFLKRTDERNERVIIFLEHEGDRVVLNLVSGMLARTVLCDVEKGKVVEQGEKVGTIVLGSRVDVEFSDIWTATISKGQKVKSGLSVIARKKGSA